MSYSSRLSRTLAVLAALLLLPATYTAAASSTADAFTAGAAGQPAVSFTTAKAKAAREGKVLLVDFTATWCMPCRWMNETTFVDAEVLSYLREHYVSIKVDVDDFDGYALKEAYGVRTLPTMIIFSSAGEPVDRIEESVGPTELVERLVANNVSQHRHVYASSEVPAHDWTEPFAAAGNAYAEPAVETSHIIAATATPQTPAHSKVVRRAAVQQTAPLQVLAQAEPDLVASLSQPFEAPTMRPCRAELFSIQTGVYSSRENALAAAEALVQYTDSGVLLEFGGSAEQAVYRVYVGQFDELDEAEQLSAHLRAVGFQCVARAVALN